MGKEAHEGEMRNDGMVYWPGTDIKKSLDNGFVLGLRQSEGEWSSITASAVSRAASTSFVQRKREAGVDPGAIYGISQKSDDRIRHGGAYLRAAAGRPKKKREKVDKSGKRGPAIGSRMLPESKTGLLRTLLADGPKTGRELANGSGVAPTKITGLLKNDVKHKRVLKIVEPNKAIRYALPEAA